MITTSYNKEAGKSSNKNYHKQLTISIEQTTKKVKQLDNRTIT